MLEEKDCMRPFINHFGPIILKLVVCFGNRSSISTPHRKVLPLLEEISQKKMRQNLASNLRIFLPPRDPPTRLCFHHCWNVWNWKLPKVCEECFLMILSPSNCVAYIRITRFDWNVLLEKRTPPISWNLRGRDERNSVPKRVVWLKCSARKTHTTTMTVFLVILI